MNIEDPKKHVKGAWVAGIISAGVTLIVSLISVTGHSLTGHNLWGLLDVALMAGLIFGIYRFSRACALIMLVYFAFSKLMMWVDTGRLSGLLGGLIFGYFFFQGVRGTFAYHNLKDTTNAA
jgi:serine/threonine-protein kinase